MTNLARNKVIAVGLDAADPNLYEPWMAAGHLDNLKRLCDRGAYTRLSGLDYSVAEGTWTAILSGVKPEKTGFWTQMQLQSGSYDVKNARTYDYTEFPPFYAVGNDFRVAAVDIPQTRISDQVNGVQVLAYGAHSPQTPRVSQPEGLLSKLINTYGDHPTIENDFARLWWRHSMSRLKNGLIKGAGLRGRICRDMLWEEDWDLFFTVFGEPHAAGHYFWHLSQPDHPLYNIMKGQLGEEDPLLAVCKAVDQALGQIMAAAPADATIMAFSQEGLGANNLDLPSLLFLPELLYRMSFPGQRGFIGGPPGTNQPPGEIQAHPYWTGWTRGVWGLKHDDNQLRGFLRRHLPLEAGRLVEAVMGDAPGPEYPKTSRPAMQLPLWYSRYWPKMKAFALPSFSHGYVRLNVSGREPTGIVAPEDYEATCNEITDHLRAMTNARTGEKLVDDVIRTRSHAGADERGKNDADLVVIWAYDPADVVDSPTFGRIGPIPFKRSSGHTNIGFTAIAGPGIEAGQELPQSTIYDLAPTILNRMGAPVPDYLDGQPLMMH